MLDEWIPDAEERAWVRPRLEQLLCLCEPEPEERQNLFSAWRLLFERLAARGPVVLVFEDLQWADASLLDFIEHLLDWSRAHPIFVLALARPELGQKRAGFGAGGTSLPLEPLSEAAMGELLDGFVPGLPPELRTQILERSEGVPLYAVETVRMLLDRELLARDGDLYRPTGPIAALDVPETLHALVAARIDGLSPDERSALQDAAVLGKSFTKPGLAALSGLDDETLDRLLTSLVRKEVLSVQADPRSPERGQYSFLQDLLKRIAYDTLSRPERKARHIAAAQHLERTASSTETEFVEVIAAHYLDAYEAAPDADDAQMLRAKAAEQLTLAGERSAALAATEEAQRYFEKAAALADDDLIRANLFERAGDAAHAGSRYDASLETLEAAAELYNAVGETHAAAKVTAHIGLVMWRQGDLRGAVDRMAGALEVLADDEPDEEIAGLVEMNARLTYFLGDHQLAWERVERALEIAEALPAPEVLADGLNTKSLLLHARGRFEEGSALLDRAIAIGREHDLGITLLRALNNYCVQLSAMARLPEMTAAAKEGEELSAKLGHREHEQQFLSFVTLTAWLLGDWDTCETLVERFTAPGPYPTLFRTSSFVYPQASQGRLEDCRRAFAELEPYRTSDDAQMAAGVYRCEGVVLLAEGRYAEAAAAFRTCDEVISSVHPRIDSLTWSLELEALANGGDADALEERLAAHDAMTAVERTAWVTAAYARFHGRLLALRGDTAGAAEELTAAARGFAALGTRFHDAATLVELTELTGEALPAEARATLDRLDAKPWLARADAAERAVTV
jgi:tetratricopeptide (TPR) repeat protein